MCYNGLCQTALVAPPGSYKLVAYTFKAAGGREAGPQVRLCEACVRLATASHFCDFCFQIYYSSEEYAEMDGK